MYTNEKKNKNNFKLMENKKKNSIRKNKVFVKFSASDNY